MTIEEEFKKAKRVSFQFLKVRNRSEKEIRDQLFKKKISGETIQQTLSYLKKLELINDRQFARDWIQMRLQKPLGLRRIFFELRQKGIGAEILEQEGSSLAGKINEEETAATVARKRLERYKNLEESKRKRRVFQYLAQRGFDVDVVTKVVEKL